ncbi:MBL fold metallo-hydrolase [Anaerocolumna sedimenticola]|uniref:MBL fold metallo-hydrolase n=1 Tax=Anaerocolumna sedimenticola TaxID=2696063 RepID=A0A6P1TUG4_9FIRM|nr:MBL fold metallo-hydrolase [Anaerocolumna sedimenticola]QHQ63326.1 MBL fold metallo-hydrolase [Anaerocolumna sedimenticola]
MIIRNLYGNLYEADFVCNDHYIKQVIYFILEGSNALLIDTGYEKEAKQLNVYFDERSIHISKVIISHYHEDHFAGLKTLKSSNKNITIFGSSEFKQTLEKEYKEDFLLDSDIFPTTFCDNYKFIFGGHNIRFEAAKGHSDCSIHTIIDEKYVHVADNIMYDTNNMPLLPLPCASIIEHLTTLEKLKENLNVFFIGSHFSSAINNYKDMKTEIDARINYMHKVLEHEGNIEYDSIKEKLPITFNPIWHHHMIDYYQEQRTDINN